MIEENGRIRSKGRKRLSDLNQMEMPGLNSSVSMSNLVSHIGDCLSEQTSSCNPTFASNEPPSKDIVEQVSQYLFNDAQLTSASDERFIMSRVSSLCCLLQNEPERAQNLQLKNTTGNRRTGKSSPIAASCESKTAVDFLTVKNETEDVSSCRHPPVMSRKDSVGELLLNLPRIGSLPQFLFNI